MKSGVVRRGADGFDDFSRVGQHFLLERSGIRWRDVVAADADDPVVQGVFIYLHTDLGGPEPAHGRSRGTR